MEWYGDLRGSLGLAVLSKAPITAHGQSPPAPTGSGSGPTQGWSNLCLSFPTSAKCSFCPASLSPSPHSSYSSSQKASSLENVKIQGDSIQCRRLGGFIYIYIVLLLPHLWHLSYKVSPSILLGEIKAEQSPFTELGIPVVQKNAVK